MILFPVVCFFLFAFFCLWNIEGPWCFPIKPYYLPRCIWVILAQCSISIPPDYVRKPEVFLTFSGGIEMENWAKMVKLTTQLFLKERLKNFGTVLTQCQWYSDQFTHVLPFIYMLVSSGVSLTSWGEGASLALVGNPSSDGITIKIPHEVDVLLHRPA